MISNDELNQRPDRVSVLVAEIETGTRLRVTRHAVATDFGVVPADRVVWFPPEMVGEHFGEITDAQRRAVVDAACLVIRGSGYP